MKRRRIPLEIKEEIIRKVEQGRAVSEAAGEHGVKAATVYNWLGRRADGNGKEVLEMSRLRRENEALMKLVGRITYQMELSKKNRVCMRRS